MRARGSAARWLPTIAVRRPSTIAVGRLSTIAVRRLSTIAVRRLSAIAMCALCAFIASGCSGASSRGDSTSSRPTTAANLLIVSPAPNEHTGTTVDVRLRLDHARVMPASQVGGAIRPDQGHIHLTLDGQLVAMPSQLTDRLPRLTPGIHTLQAEFVATDHLPFANRVVAAVTFRAR